MAGTLPTSLFRTMVRKSRSLLQGYSPHQRELYEGTHYHMAIAGAMGMSALLRQIPLRGMVPGIYEKAQATGAAFQVLQHTFTSHYPHRAGPLLGEVPESELSLIREYVQEPAHVEVKGPSGQRVCGLYSSLQPTTDEDKRVHEDAAIDALVAIADASDVRNPKELARRMKLSPRGRGQMQRAFQAGIFAGLFQGEVPPTLRLKRLAEGCVYAKLFNVTRSVCAPKK